MLQLATKLTIHIVYGSKAEYILQGEDTLREILTEDPSVAAIVCFDSWVIAHDKESLLHSCSGHEDRVHELEGLSTYRYAGVPSPGFIIPGHSDFKISTAGVAHTRTLTFVKKHLGGPHFDLERIWDEHTHYEFGDRSVEKTMATMVQEPYVNHIPTVRDTSDSGSTQMAKYHPSADGRDWASSSQPFLPPPFYLQQSR